MRLRSLLVGIAFLGLPTVSLAGPIPFEITETGFWVQPDRPALVAGLYSPFTSGSFVVDPTTGLATTVGPLVMSSASLLPQPGPLDVHPDGTTFWNESGLFRVDLRLTDTGTGEFADISIDGMAHSNNQYANGAWSGTVTYWFSGYNLIQHATLGGNDYAIWGRPEFTQGLPSVTVWVGDNGPVPWAPEPSTLVLASFALIPLGRRYVRRRLGADGATSGNV